MKLKTSFEFDAAHRLVGYYGKCNNLHGHMWHVDVEIEDVGKGLDNIGMLIDFTEMKAIKDELDHKTILKRCPENKVLIELLKSEQNEVYIMEENPTAENLCKEILYMLQEEGVKFKIKVWESPKSYAEIEG